MPTMPPTSIIINKLSPYLIHSVHTIHITWNPTVITLLSNYGLMKLLIRRITNNRMPCRKLHKPFSFKQNAEVLVGRGSCTLDTKTKKLSSTWNGFITPLWYVHCVFHHLVCSYETEATYNRFVCSFLILPLLYNDVWMLYQILMMMLGGVEA